MDLTRLIDADLYQSGTENVLGKCRDLLVDTEANMLAFLDIEMGGWFAPSHALFSASRLSIEGPRLFLEATPYEVAARSETPAGAERAPDASQMPPLVVGPFGYTVSPAMSAALISAFRSREDDMRPAVDEDNDSLQWFTRLQGAPVFDATGPLGDLADIVVNPKDLSCVSLKTTDNGQHGIFDFDKIRRITHDKQSIILKSHKPDTALARVLESLGPDARR